MLTEEEAADRARRIAIRLVAERVTSSDDVPASYDELRTMLADLFSFFENEWLDDLLELVGNEAAAECRPDGWSDVPLPQLTQDEIDRQTSSTVTTAFDDPEAPAAPTAGPRI